MKLYSIHLDTVKKGKKENGVMQLSRKIGPVGWRDETADVIEKAGRALCYYVYTHARNGIIVLYLTVL